MQLKSFGSGSSIIWLNCSIKFKTWGEKQLSGIVTKLNATINDWTMPSN